MHIPTHTLVHQQTCCFNWLFTFTHHSLVKTLLSFSDCLCPDSKQNKIIPFWGFFGVGGGAFNLLVAFGKNSHHSENSSLWTLSSTWRYIPLPFNYACEEINVLGSFSSKLGSITLVFFENVLRSLQPLYIIQFLLRLALLFYELWTDHKCTE